MSDRLLADLRYAIRLFVRAPVWTTVAIVSLRPFPYRDPSQLAAVLLPCVIPARQAVRFDAARLFRS